MSSWQAPKPKGLTSERQGHRISAYSFLILHVKAYLLPMLASVALLFLASSEFSCFHAGAQFRAFTANAGDGSAPHHDATLNRASLSLP